jgi:phosphatidylinositol alpha-mannosyltransferase
MNAAGADLGGGGHRHGGLLAVVMTMAVLAGLVVLGANNLDLHAVGHTLGRVNGAWTVLALVLMAAAFYARAESWFAVLRSAVRCESLDRGTVRRALLIGMAGSAVAPGRLGEGARAWIVSRRLGRASGTFATVLGTVVSQTLLNLIALGLLAIAAVLDSSLAGARLAAIITVVVLPAALVAIMFAGPQLLRGATATPVAWVKTAAAWTLGQLIRVRRGLLVFRQPRAAVHATAAQLSAWSLQLGACYAVMLACGLGHRANVAAAAAVLFAVNVTAIVPVTPSNVGVFQAACIAVLHPFGIEANRALAYGLILQAVEVFDALALGIPALLREGLPWAELRRRTRTRLADER